MQFDLVVHATHEAGVKMGGIGAVLQGLLGAKAYNQHVARTILVGPMSTHDAVEMERLTAPGNRIEIHYSSHHSIDQVPAILSTRLRAIERDYGIRLLYGHRAFGEVNHQVILIDGARALAARTNAYKAQLYTRFGIQCDRYEDNPEFSRYIDAAEPGYRALQAIAGQGTGPRCIIAHEFMGLPLCYSAMLHDPGAYCTVFYGHEVATVRPIVESHAGHDTMFYNVLERALAGGQTLDDVFGDQSGFFKHGLIHPAATVCDNILAVGDRVVQEMRFLGPDWARANIDLVYNGVPSYPVAAEQQRESLARLQRYCSNLLGYHPDHVFSHVTRFVPSKGLWRDIRVMERLDPRLYRQGRTAVLYVLSSVIPVGRPVDAVHQMEATYGWPARHRVEPVQVDGVSVPDLVSHEVPFYRAIEQFNQSAQASQIVLVNQFGWSQDRCGTLMPSDMSFADIRHGTDLEFGQSIYEPFGIAQLEPLSSGALCVLSSVCGCLGFVRRSGGIDLTNLIVADYTDISGLFEQDSTKSIDITTLKTIGRSRRDRIEATQAQRVAHQIADRLTGDVSVRSRYIRDGNALSQAMSWEVVARDYLLPALDRAVVRSLYHASIPTRPVGSAADNQLG